MVTAIVVAHDGARWLGDTLTAVTRQTRRVDRLVGVDNGSRDGSGQIFAGALGQGNVLALPRSTGFGEAVAEVLARLPAGGGAEWIWLLHDDCAPDERALEALLWAADQDPKAAVLGPKLRDWLDRRLLLEVGVTVDRTGRRDTGLEAREYDQGQYDGVRDVLSVSTAGMLIRRDVWDEVGGLDPALAVFRDDLDLCWRVRNAGHRVLNVTYAVAWHAEAATRRRRRVTASVHHPRRLDRRNAMFVIMANLPFLPMLWALLRNVFGSLFRTVLFILAKQPANALDEFSALGSILAHPGRVITARRKRAKGRKKNYPQVKRLMTPPGAAYRRLADMVQGYLSGAGPVESAGRHHAASAEPSQDDGEELLADAGVLQRVFGNPGVLLFLALLAITVAAERSLLGGTLLGGGALVPVAGGASDLWRFYLDAFHATGVGTDAWAPPYVAVVAAVSTLFLGKTWLAVTVLLLGSVPLAGVSAYLATRSMIPRAGARVWLAATYALLPVATGAIAAGRLGTAVVLALLPVYASLATVLLAGEGRRARRAAWGLGLLLAVGTAFVPLVYLLTAVIGVLGATAFGSARRGVGVSVGIALGVPVLLLFPWFAQIARHPGRLLLEAGLHQPALVDPRLPAADLLTLSPGGPGVPPLWTVSGLLAVALAALLMRRRRIPVAVGWGVTVFGVLVAILVSRIPVTSMAGSPQAPGWPGVPLAFAATGMLVVAALTADRLAEFRAAGGVRRIGALLIAAVAFSAPLLAAGQWVLAGAGGPLRADLPDAMPILAAAGSRQGESTLVMRSSPAGGLTYTVLRGRTPLIGESDLPAGAPARDRLAVAASGLASGRGGDDTDVLATYGVRFVVLAAPIDPEVGHALDSQPGLARLSLSRSAGVWRLTRPLGRTWIAGPGGARTPLAARRDADGGLTVNVPAGAAGRTLVLAEPAGGWTATAEDESLTAKTVDGWAQGFTLGAEATGVRIAFRDTWHTVWLWAQAALLVVILVLASPGSRDDDGAPDYADPAEPAEQPAQPAQPDRAAPAGRRGRRAKAATR
ncbi:integral membrane regulatory protein [Microtetraspora sp. NBRC 13810]|nr:integral membrane regulatory protein [Microtetraspora sp. NBRC 13810]